MGGGEAGKSVETKPGGPARAEAGALFAEALAATKLKITDKLIALVTARPEIANLQDSEGRSCLHYAAEHSEGMEEVLSVAGVNCGLKDQAGNTPLHYAATASCPMAAYALVKACPEACLATNKAGKTAADIAKENSYGEVLNAMLLASCSTEANPKDSSQAALAAIEMLLEAGAVPDTWAPNGNSALMMAASADSPAAIAMLLEKSAQINMKDTLGRTALMFAAGNDARNALRVLMEVGGQEALSLQDNRGNNVTKYACGEETKRMVESRFAELEAAATAHQAALLADLAAEEQTAATAKHRRGHRGKKKKKAGSKGQFPGSAFSTEEGAVADPEDAKEPVSCSEAAADPSHDPLVEAPGNREVEEPVFIKDALETDDGDWQPTKIRADPLALPTPKAGSLSESIISIKADSTTKDNMDAQTDSSQLYISALESSRSSDLRDTSAVRGQAAEDASEGGTGTAVATSTGSNPSAEESSEALEGRPHLSQADRDTIAAALENEGSGCKDVEPMWQEVKKSAKGGSSSRPPLGQLPKRSFEKFYDVPQSLLPSSSSVSLDSLGDSSASGASALSFPSGALHTVHHLMSGATHQSNSNSGNGAHTCGRRLSKFADPVTPAPLRALGCGPRAVGKPSSTDQPRMSWANVVQGRGAEASASEGRDLSSQAPGQDEVGLCRQDAIASGAQTASEACIPASCTEAAADSPETGMGAENGTKEANARCEDELRAENQLLQQQLAQAEATRAQLEIRLVAVQQDHRLLLQKAVEDTARNVLHQEHLRYRQTIEGLQLLVLQAHQQLQSQEQHLPMRATSSPVLRAAAGGKGATAAASPQLFTPPSFLQPIGIVVSSPTFSASPRAAPRASSPGLSSRESQKSFPGRAPTATASLLPKERNSKGVSGTASNGTVEWPPLSVQPAASSPIAPAVASTNGPTASAANPWAMTEGFTASGGTSKKMLRPMLPSLDTIWGPS